MKTILSAVIALAVVIALCIVGWQYALYRQANSPEGIEAKHRAAVAIQIRDKAEARVSALAADRCATPVQAILKLNDWQQIIGVKDIPSTLASDIFLCLERGIMSPYDKNRLIDVNLLKLFVAA